MSAAKDAAGAKRIVNAAIKVRLLRCEDMGCFPGVDQPKRTPFMLKLFQGTSHFFVGDPSAKKCPLAAGNSEGN